MLSLLQAGCQAEPSLTITLGGDVILGREGQAFFTQDPWGGMARAGLPSENAQNWFVVNLESPLGSLAETDFSFDEGYNLCAPVKAAEILKMGGVDLVSIANNHQYDCGERADLSLVIPGITSAAEGRPVILESSAGTIVILAVDAVSKPLDMAAFLARVVEVREKADVLIVSLHWGVEYAGEPTRLQREQTQQLADAGVDVLWGHHPHVLQPAEWVDSQDGGHHMLALYSLGNLLTDQTMTYETRHSALVQLQIKEGEISQLSVQPLVLNQTDGMLVLAIPDDTESSYIGDRLGWPAIKKGFTND